MKTLQPLILTAHIADADLKPFNDLRQAHFPPERKFPQAHLTIFHRLPAEYLERVATTLEEVAEKTGPVSADVIGVRHLGAGVAFTIASLELQHVHAQLKSAFASWLGGQDMQKWQPHITIQNKVSRSEADALHRAFTMEFKPCAISITGLDLWRYMQGPWQHEATMSFQR
nr:phosphoesterase HXTX [Rhizobium sp. Q54]